MPDEFSMDTVRHSNYCAVYLMRADIMQSWLCQQFLKQWFPIQELHAPSDMSQVKRVGAAMLPLIDEYSHCSSIAATDLV